MAYKIYMVLDACCPKKVHYSDVIMSFMASQITRISIVCSALVRGIHR